MPAPRKPVSTVTGTRWEERDLVIGGEMVDEFDDDLAKVGNWLMQTHCNNKCNLLAEIAIHSRLRPE